MKKRLYITAFAIITASACVLGGCVLNEKAENGAVKVSAALTRKIPDFQNQIFFKSVAETQNLYHANSLNLYSNSVYANSTADLKYEFWQLSKLNEGSDPYAAKMREINRVWGRISILAGKLNTQSVAVNRAGSINNGEGAATDASKQAIGVNIKKELKAPISVVAEFLNFLKLNHYGFTFTYSAS